MPTGTGKPDRTGPNRLSVLGGIARANVGNREDCSDLFGSVAIERAFCSTRRSSTRRAVSEWDPLVRNIPAATSSWRPMGWPPPQTAARFFPSTVGPA